MVWSASRLSQSPATLPHKHALLPATSATFLVLSAFLDTYIVTTSLGTFCDQLVSQAGAFRDLHTAEQHHFAGGRADHHAARLSSWHHSNCYFCRYARGFFMLPGQGTVSHSDKRPGSQVPKPATSQLCRCAWVSTDGMLKAIGSVVLALLAIQCLIDGAPTGGIAENGTWICDRVQDVNVTSQAVIRSSAIIQAQVYSINCIGGHKLFKECWQWPRQQRWHCHRYALNCWCYEERACAQPGTGHSYVPP